MVRFLVLIILFVFLESAVAWAEPRAVSKADQEKWLCWLLPLPKQISIEAAVNLKPSEVGIRARPDSGDVEKTAVEEFAHFWQDKTGITPAGEAFKIIVGVCDDAGQLDGKPVAGAERLKDLPNRDQAYVMVPEGTDRLVLAALDENGVYYAMRTLCQLLEAHVSAERVVIPLATVLDWPDLEERGEWGGSSVEDIVWMAAYKMNHVERHVKLKVGPDGKGYAETDTDHVELARRHALEVVPIITHLDQLGRTGLYEVFPDVEGKGAGALVPGQEGMHAPCASNPKFQQVLADWMASLAGQKGVNDVCAWLSECEAKCGCEQCQQVGQYALEARCLVAAWRIAREQHPGLRLRILLTQGSYATNDKVLAECPPEVGVTYYDGGRTYNSSRDPMIYPLLEDFAAKGGWLGCYPQLTASWRIVCPWTGPQFIQCRMREFVDKKLRGLCGYATPDNRLYEFNFLAAAEWAWNAHGRTPEQFAQAWATRRGFTDPDAAAQWAVMLGPVGWDLYGSGVPFPYFFGGAVETIKARKSFEWNKGMLRYFPDKAHLDADIAMCGQALDIAQKLDAPELIGETLSIQGYLQMISDLAEIADLYQGDVTPDAPKLASLRTAMDRLANAAFQTSQAMKQWEHAANQHHCGRGRFCDTLNVTRKVAREMNNLLPAAASSPVVDDLFGHEIGQWTSDEFEQQEKITKTLDVAKLVTGPGEYHVEFIQGAGVNGLKIHRVALLDQAAQPPNEIVADEHEGLATSEHETTEYVLKLEKHDPDARYALVAQITGVRSSDKRVDLRGCNGTITLATKKAL